MKYLSLLTLLPLLGSLVVAFVPRSRPEVAKVLALAFSLVVFGIAVAAWFAFDPDGGRSQLLESYKWIPAWGAKFTFAVDGIGLVMIALSALLVLVRGPTADEQSTAEQAQRAGQQAQHTEQGYASLVLQRHLAVGQRGVGVSRPL